MTTDQNYLDPHARIRTATGYVVACSLLFLFVVVVTVLSVLAMPASTDQGNALVAEFSGVDDGEVGPVQVGDQWEFRWEHEGHLKRITWTRSDGEEDMFMEMPGKPIRGHGGINYKEGGEYRFRVEGTGPWKIQVYQFGDQ